ncbi:MAG: hypothetical protein ACK5Y2_07495 [Bdellovibrionales bacterium]
MSFVCFNCQTSLSPQEPISRHEECPKCREDVRCCRNCQFYDPKVYNECRETQAERILEKHRANLCDFFRPQLGPSTGLSESQKALDAAEALFKGLKKS